MSLVPPEEGMAGGAQRRLDRLVAEIEDFVKDLDEDQRTLVAGSEVGRQMLRLVTLSTSEVGRGQSDMAMLANAPERSRSPGRMTEGRVVLAELRTSRVIFHAIGQTVQDATCALGRGWAVHCGEVGCDPDFEALGLAEDVRYLEMSLGSAARDMDVVLCGPQEPRSESAVNEDGHLKVLFDPRYRGGHYAGSPSILYLLASEVDRLGLNEAFERVSGYSAAHIVACPEELFTADGRPLEAVHNEHDEPEP